MTDAAVERRTAEARVSLGVPDLDRMLEGGLMPHRPYLIVGPSGTGKTTLALQFLCEGVRRGERGLYVTLEDPPNEVRWNHRALRPALDKVDVFDAIPDVMRYEHVPFKDIAAVRQVVPFAQIPEQIRQTPEFASVEVTGTALEQMLRGEVQRHGYTRLVIDSLTALQFFCMKGRDPTVGAQTFLRFLTDLRTTTLLTIESPLEDAETPERMLARGEIQLFRWELDGFTVRAVGVEKYRGSSHDVHLHPYRIGSRGIDVQLAQTISRDTRRIVEPTPEGPARPETVPIPPAPSPRVEVAAVAPSEPLSQQVRDLVTLGVDIAPLRTEVEATLEAVRSSRTAEVAARLARISAMAISLVPADAGSRLASRGTVDGPVGQALQRVAARAERSRGGVPPTGLPSAETLARELTSVLGMIPAPPAPVRAPEAAPPPAAAPPPRVSPRTIARATELLGEPVGPAVAPPAAPPPRERPAAEPPPAPPRAEPTPSRPSGPRARRVATLPLPEHPPLPTVYAPPPAELAGPTVEETRVPPSTPAAPKPAKRARAAARKPPAPVEPAPSSPGAPVPEEPAARRPRRPAAGEPSALGAEPAPPAAAEMPALSPTTSKPRKRSVRRKKAPPVVHAEPAAPTPEPTAAPPPEEPPPADGPSPGPPEAT